MCGLCQTILYRSISVTIHPRIGVFFILATVLSAGNFHASTAYLPSSFTMYTGMLGAAAFMNWKGGIRTATGIAWFATGGIVGWPFAMALSAPFLVEQAGFLLVTLRNPDHFFSTVRPIFMGGGVALLILVSIVSCCHIDKC